MRHRRWVTAFILLNSTMYLLLLLSEWLLPGAARINAQIIGSVGAGLCAIFGIKLIEPRGRVTGEGGNM